MQQPLEEPPTHFSKMKRDEVTHLLCQRERVNAKMEEKIKNRRVSSYTKPDSLTATQHFLFPLHICFKGATFTNAHNVTVRRPGKEDKKLLGFQQLTCYIYIVFSLSDIPRF